MKKDGKIYVAGHGGLVGSAIVRMLREKGYTNIIGKRSAELDLTRQADTEAFFAAEKPDYVFMCAAKVGGIYANSVYPDSLPQCINWGDERKDKLEVSFNHAGPEH